MINKPLCPDKIWDVKYNKDNKLLREYILKHYYNKLIKTNLDNYEHLNGIDKLKLIKKFNFNLFHINRNLLHLLIIYCCYFYLNVTTAIPIPHLLDINSDNNNNNSISAYLITNIQIENEDNITNFSSTYISRFDNSSNYIDKIVKYIYDNGSTPIQIRKILEASNHPDEEYDYEDGDMNDIDIFNPNNSEKGMYVGSPCEKSCNPNLHHVICDPTTNRCSCAKNYPVIIEIRAGCAEPRSLGEQCFYHQACAYNDANSACVQVSHNALCQCIDGFHSVSYSKPIKRVFCTQDIADLTSDLPTLLGVTTGIAVLAGLICMVLHLFSKTKYPRHRNFGDANIPPPIMYSSDTVLMPSLLSTSLPAILDDTGIPLTVQSGRPSSRSSLRSSGSIGSYGNRRPSSAPQPGSKGVLVSTSRTGSRRPSLASIHSTSSSIRSYSMMRFEKEIQQKEIRQEMKLRLARLQQQQFSQSRPQIIVDAISHGAISKVIIPTPSPLTPNSTDELLPSVDETQEFSPKLGRTQDIPHNTMYDGPCSSSSEDVIQIG